MRSCPQTCDLTAGRSHLPERESPAVGPFERLPKWLNCIPLVTQWLWLGLRHGSVTLPSSANPAITSGGMVGDGKLEYFSCMGEHAKSHTASYMPVHNSAGVTLTQTLLRMREHGLDFPLVAKPDLGWCGYGVQLLHNPAQLAAYLESFPQNETVVLQRYLPETGEAGIFYARPPGRETGAIIGICLRSFPQVKGDGVHTLTQLIARDKRMLRIKNGLHKPAFDPQYIPARGETIRLATIGSTRVGGLYRDGSEYATPALTEAVEAIASDMKDFHIGRFDVRYESLEQLRAGKNFTIMEVNGSGSEAIHAWDPKYSIWESYKIIFAKQRLLFQISDANRRQGHPPIRARKLAQLHFNQQRLIKLYPPSN